ncbi:MAG: hypothetical protein Q9225_002461 [Loekoesia sp. 1 TL-2023]
MAVDVDLAVALAERHNGEIINGDALQMYEGLPIATNKLPLAERKSIPHHLLGCIRLDEEPWTVGQYVETALGIIGDIVARGKLPIVVGGTHYYMQSLLFQTCLVNINAEHRTAKDQEKKWPILAASAKDMLDELHKIDPEEASRWHPNDRRKIRHSLEVYLISGKKPSDLYQEQRKSIAETRGSQSLSFQGNNHGTPPQDGLSSMRFDPLILWLYADLDKLSARLNQRVENMVQAGLVEEVRLMLQYLQKQEQSRIHLDQKSGIWAAIGFKELLPYVSASENSTFTINRLEEMKTQGIERTQTATRQYARRQHRWIRGQLLRALHDHHALDRMVLVNATELSRWQHDVETTANSIVYTFLKGETIPRSAMLPDVESEAMAACATPQIKARYCDICDTTLMTQKEWDNHPKSKRHRRAAKTPVDWQALYPKSKAQENAFLGNSPLDKG